MEGSGFAILDAVTAYLEAMKAGDLSGMLSTFAIETYIQNVNAAASLERMRAFVPRDVLPLPLGGEYQRQIATAVRCAELVDDLYLQMLTLSWPEAYSDSYDDMIVQFEDEDGIDDFLAAMADSDIDAMLQGLELTGFADPTELSERYASEAVQQIIEKQRSAYGCDEIADVAALVTLGGEEYYQFMQCVRYGEKWYNFTQAGTSLPPNGRRLPQRGIGSRCRSGGRCVTFTAFKQRRTRASAAVLVLFPPMNPRRPSVTAAPARAVARRAAPAPFWSCSCTARS